MIMYKIKNHLVIKVEVEEIEDGKAEWLGVDSEGDTIYKNTHFGTSVEAYKKAIKNCEAGVSLSTNSIERDRNRKGDLMLEKIISVIQAQIQQEEKELKEKEENNGKV